jgi:DNA-binding NarL/FixJ family response regulator
LVEPHNLMRNALEAMLKLETDLQIVGSMADGESVIRSLHTSKTTENVQALCPDIILIDTFDGWSVIQQILDPFPSAKILVLSTFDRQEDIIQAMQAGATGYLLKNMPASELAEAIRLTHRGYSQIAPGLMKKLLTKISDSPRVQPQLENISLTPRERDILRLIGQGCTNREIATHLYLAEGTIKTYVTRLLNHLTLRNRSQLASYATSIASVLK